MLESGKDTIALFVDGKTTIIQVDSEWPICSINGERKSIDDLGPSETSLQDAVQALLTAASPEEAWPAELAERHKAFLAGKPRQEAP